MDAELARDNVVGSVGNGSVTSEDVTMDSVLNGKGLGKVARRQVRQRGRLLECLKEGATGVEACKIVGVSSTTFYRWQQECEVFEEQVGDIQFERSLEGWRELKEQAFGRFVEVEVEKELSGGPVKVRQRKWVPGRIGALRLYLKRIGEPLVDAKALLEYQEARRTVADLEAQEAREGGLHRLLAQKLDNCRRLVAELEGEAFVGILDGGGDGVGIADVSRSEANEETYTKTGSVSSDVTDASGKTDNDVSSMVAAGDPGDVPAEMEVPTAGASDNGNVSRSEGNEVTRAVPAGSMVRAGKGARALRKEARRAAKGK